MNFKHYIQLREDPLPGLGLIRTYRDTYRNEKSYQKAVERRDKICFNTELNSRCKTYKDYKTEKYKMTQVYRILCNGLPEDVVKYLLTYYAVCPLVFIQKTSFYLFKEKDYYKWYIMISNILFTIKEKYHKDVLNIFTLLSHYNYLDTFKEFLKELGKLRVLHEDGLLFECKSESIFDIAAQYKKYLNDMMYYMYYNIRL